MTNEKFTFMVNFIVYWWRTAVFTEHFSAFADCLTALCNMPLPLNFSHCRILGLKSFHFVRLLLLSSIRETHESQLLLKLKTFWYTPSHGLNWIDFSFSVFLKRLKYIIRFNVYFFVSDTLSLVDIQRIIRINFAKYCANHICYMLHCHPGDTRPLVFLFYAVLKVFPCANSIAKTMKFS